MSTIKSDKEIKEKRQLKDNDLVRELSPFERAVFGVCPECEAKPGCYCTGFPVPWMDNPRPAICHVARLDKAPHRIKVEISEIK